jgi:hypothetical protein
VALVEAVWFVVSLPFRAFFWFIWKCSLGGYWMAAKLQERVGHRNAALIVLAAMALYGVLTVVGFFQRGGPVLGGIIVVFSVAFGVWVARRYSNEKVSVPIESVPYLTSSKYDPAEWRVSWPPVIFVTIVVAVIFVLALQAGTR